MSLQSNAFVDVINDELPASRQQQEETRNDYSQKARPNLDNIPSGNARAGSVRVRVEIRSERGTPQYHMRWMFKIRSGVPVVWMTDIGKLSFSKFKSMDSVKFVPTILNRRVRTCVSLHGSPIHGFEDCGGPRLYPSPRSEAIKPHCMPPPANFISFGSAGSNMSTHTSTRT